MINIRAWDIRKQIGKCCFNNQVIIGNDKDSDITVILYMNPEISPEQRFAVRVKKVINNENRKPKLDTFITDFNKQLERPNKLLIADNEDY